ncbi:hypothetical protein BC938DRAFT_479106 [Jimgerdemannia flammicorona]|uniref:Inhibitor I9 domain-containing protein n=1 Tax=Jimgerdemannia flammicorona TaxID=994334 RepID=A0A433QLK3_9FUNG|nr:hypothetical protein BC938DRAFT_479106 [Jimgerdemannia flammicorona]
MKICHLLLLACLLSLVLVTRAVPIEADYPKGFIIIFRDEVPENVLELAVKLVRELGGEVRYQYTGSFCGLSIYLPDGVGNPFTTDEWVDYIETDGPGS